MKHTKGEWKQRKLFDEPLKSVNENGCGWIHNQIYIQGKDGRIICDVSYSTDHKDMGWGQNETIEKWKANAKLIAAAPEMIELLNEIFETVNLSDHSMDLYKRTESLIKKAIK